MQRRVTLVERYALPPREIEERSFRILDGLLPRLDCSPSERQVIARIAHAAGDADVARAVRLHPRAVEAAIAALKAGASIYTDVRMVAVGVSQPLLKHFGCEVHCAIADPRVAARAQADGTTRAIAAMRHFAPGLTGAVVAIGNAPTALLALLDMVDAGDVRPAVIVGMPVGFVAAPESKAELALRDVPYITVEGPRGGSAMAAATLNALLLLARDGPGGSPVSS